MHSKEKQTKNYGSNRYLTCPNARKNTASVPLIAFQENTEDEFKQTLDCALLNSYLSNHPSKPSSFGLNPTLWCSEASFRITLWFPQEFLKLCSWLSACELAARAAVTALGLVLQSKS